MAIQTIFQAGNSNVIAIPPDIMRKANIKIGEKVSVELLPNTEGILVRKEQKGKKSSGVNKEFKQWLEKTLEEDKDILVDLANR